MTRLQELHQRFQQSPWLDDLRRDWLQNGELDRWIARGIRGVTCNPSIFQKALAASDAYDEALRALAAQGATPSQALWVLMTEDTRAALKRFRGLYDQSGGSDGFVSLELAPAIAHDTTASIESARALHQLIEQPNLLVKIPATPEGIPAIRAMTAEGRSINVTLIFSLERYAQVIESYLSGLEEYAGDLARVHSVASFFVSRVDTEVDQRLEDIGRAELLELRGQAAVAQAKLAYRIFRDRFSGPRWRALADRGANLQRPLWASTSTKNPAYPDTLYVDALIGTDTVSSMPADTLRAFEDHGRLGPALNSGTEQAQRLIDRLAWFGVDLSDVGTVLEEEGLQKFSDSYDAALGLLRERASGLSPERPQPAP